MNRIDRISAILIQLQSKRVVKAREIAERFDISLRTVYRDLKTLEEAGIPLFGEAGTGYSLMEGYRLPPVQFSREEATTFLMAEKIIGKYTDEWSNKTFQSALLKIKSVLRTTEKDFLEDIGPHVLVLHNNDPEQENKQRYLQELLTAIHEKRVIRMEYAALTSDHPVHRDIEPVGIYLQYNVWYLIAYCRLRKDYRTFRVDRIVHFSILEEKFSGQHPSLKEYLKIKADEKKLETVIIAIEKPFVKYLSAQKYYYGFVSAIEREQHIEMTFLSASLEDFAQWYLLIAHHAKIIQPLSMKGQIKARLIEIHKNL